MLANTFGHIIKRVRYTYWRYAKSKTKQQKLKRGKRRGRIVLWHIVHIFGRLSTWRITNSVDFVDYIIISLNELNLKQNKIKCEMCEKAVEKEKDEKQPTYDCPYKCVSKILHWIRTINCIQHPIRLLKLLSRNWVSSIKCCSSSGLPIYIKSPFDEVWIVKSVYGRCTTNFVFNFSLLLCNFFYNLTSQLRFK